MNFVDGLLGPTDVINHSFLILQRWLQSFRAASGESLTDRLREEGKSAHTGGLAGIILLF